MRSRRNDPSARTRPPVLPARAGCYATVCVLCLLMTGCASSFGTLESVVKDGHPASGSELQSVRVSRDGTTRTTELDMKIQAGDEIVTAPGTEAVLRLSAGYTVYLDSDTELAVLNPKLLLRLGKAFIQKLKEVREALKVDTEYVVAGVEGTQFLITVDADSVVTVTVVEGEVRVESKTQRWAPVIYRAKEQGAIRGRQAPERMGRLPDREIEPLIFWVREVERITTRAVPDLFGVPLRQARAVLEEQQLAEGRVRYQVTGRVEAGAVVRQDPTPKTPVRVGTKVDLWVEKESVEVPGVGGLPLEEARGRLQEAGLRLGRTRQTLSDRYEDGVVMSQDPRPGKRVDPGAPVTLEVAQAGARIPDVQRAPLREAVSRLREAGLETGEPTVIETTRYQPGTVISQSPSPGALVRRGSVVRLEVAGSVQQPPDRRPAQQCTVPDLAGRRLTQDQVARALEEAGLKLGRVIVLEFRKETVTSLEPKAGTRIECGGSVGVTFGVVG